MTKLITLFTCLTLLGATSFLTGCAGKGKTGAYKTLKTVADTVDTAMKAFSDVVVRGDVPADTQVKVQLLHEQYRVAFRQAVQLAQFDYESAAPAQVASLAAELAALIAVYVH